MWDQELKLQRTLKTSTDSCRSRDLWVTYFTVLSNVNKVALCFTSKEIALYDLSSKLEFNCQFKLKGLKHTPLSLDYWYNPDDTNEAILSWGDTGGTVNALHFNTATISLFERPTATSSDKQETCQNIPLKDVIRQIYKSTRYTKHQGHSEWVRQVKYSPHLECFISCSTTWENSLVVGWLEKHNNSNKDMKTDLSVKQVTKKTRFNISQGVNAFDYDEILNLIATAGVNHHVCLWNPYVASKPNGVLRGHMAAVILVQFNKPRSQLISFSKDKVLRIWDVQLQVCIQRLAGMFPKSAEVHSALFFDERSSRLYLTFNYQLTVLEMKPEIKNRIMSHDKPVVAALYNSTFNQVVSVCQGGSLVVWMMDSGQKVKTFSNVHGDSEVTSLAQDPSETRIFTGGSDGTIKVWDFNGHCYHTLHCAPDGQPTDLGQLLVLKRSVLVVGWAKYITIFRSQYFKEFHIEASDWKGSQVHTDDVLSLSFSAPSTLATGAYDGEIIIWNNNSEQASKRLLQRTKQHGSQKPAEASSGVDGHAVTRLQFLETRKGNSAAGGANLVSCGGNGWLRFWSTTHQTLLAEFVAHVQVGSIIMGIDASCHWLVTGDVDGLLKVWDISEYCLHAVEETLTTPPPLLSQFQPHSDLISSIELCERNERTLVLSSSTDCSVALWDIYGNKIGVFGQEVHWKIEPYTPNSDTEDGSDELSDDDLAEIEADGDSHWEPDERAVNDPDYRLNTWEHTCLGKGYQELKVRKRARRQPEIIQDLPYLHWERTGQPPLGPYGALSTTDLSVVDRLQKPDFINNPQNYFSANIETMKDQAQLPTKFPSLAETLNAAFDEKTLFPKYILDYEARMKHYHAKAISETPSRKSVKSVVGLASVGKTASFSGPSSVVTSQPLTRSKTLKSQQGSVKDMQ
ncbi:hypothetical protein NP493_327g03000 [Ridgeia piscesae]|uniref:Uncharacterized protein n=1 Tax=Ridgeia piscesae TaxID=27915 RepID=A0AAD9NUN2_RIDPI|nr:hypothetical protein NP493_327g03000 [Ridgeia piscesae]